MIALLDCSHTAEFVDLVLSATEENPAPYLIATGPGKYLLDQFPELSADIIPIPEYLLPNWLGEKFMLGAVGRRLNRGPQAEIFFGGKGSGFPVLHWDSLYAHAFNGQVNGICSTRNTLSFFIQSTQAAINLTCRM